MCLENAEAILAWNKKGKPAVLTWRREKKYGQMPVALVHKARTETKFEILWSSPYSALSFQIFVFLLGTYVEWKNFRVYSPKKKKTGGNCRRNNFMNYILHLISFRIQTQTFWIIVRITIICWGIIISLQNQKGCQLCLLYSLQTKPFIAHILS